MLFQCLALSCFDKNLTIYYDTQSRNVKLNAWFSEVLDAGQLQVCQQLDQTYFLPRVIIGSATFSRDQVLYSLKQAITLELTCEGANVSDPANPCNLIQSYSAAIFEFEFPDFPMTLTDTISYYSIDLFNHKNCLHSMKVNYNFQNYEMVFNSQANECSFDVNGPIKAALVDKDLNILHNSLAITLPFSGSTVTMNDLTYGLLYCPNGDESCYTVFKDIVRHNFKNEFIQVFIPADIVYNDAPTQKNVSLILEIASIDPRSDINCFQDLEVEIMDKALKYKFAYQGNCSYILQQPIGGKKIEYFMENIDIYIADRTLTLITRLDELELDKTELIYSCDLFQNPAECEQVLYLATSNDYQTYFTVYYMNGESLLDSFIYTSSSQYRLCHYQPVFTVEKKPCVSLRKTGACITDETYSTAFTMVLRNQQTKKYMTIESHINYPNQEENYCFVLSDDQTSELMDMLADSSDLQADLSIGGVNYLVTYVVNNAPLMSYSWSWAILLCGFVVAVACALTLWRFRVFNLPVYKQETYPE